MRPVFDRRRLSILPVRPFARTVVRAVRRVHRVLLPVALVTVAACARAEVAEVDGDALAELIASGVPVIDVRREDEWRERGVIEGSHLLTFFDADGRHDAEAWLASLADVVAAPDEPVVLLCAGGVRSKRIADLLDARLGFTAVHNVTDGIEGWREEGRPIVSYAP